MNPRFWVFALGFGLGMPGIDLGAAGATAAPLPAIAIVSVQAADPAELSALIGTANARLRERHDVPLFVRAYVGRSVAEAPPEEAFLLFPAGDLQALLARERLFASAPDLRELRERFLRLGAAGSRTHLEARRFDGAHTPGFVVNTQVVAEDETTLLAGLETWKANLPAEVSGACAINVFRVAKGDESFTHLVSFNLVSDERRARLVEILTEPGSASPFSPAARGAGAGARVVRQVLYDEVR